MERLKLEYDCLEPAPDGELVRYADAESELSALRARVAELAVEVEEGEAMSDPTDPLDVKRYALVELTGATDTKCYLCRLPLCPFKFQHGREDDTRVQTCIEAERQAEVFQEPPVVPAGWRIGPWGRGGQWVWACVPELLGDDPPPKVLRALAWAKENDDRPPHEDDDKKKE
jgi:hypothetical protein